MAKNLGEFLHGQALKAGMNPEDEALKNFLLNGELIKIQIPEEIEKGIDNNLLSIKDAKNNHPDIKNYYQKQALDSIDNSITALLTELGIDEAVKNEVLSERSTYKRVPLLVNKIKELEEKKSASTGKGDKDGLQKQIDELHTQLRVEKGNAVNIKKQYDDELIKFRIENKLDALTGTYKTIYDDLDPEVKSMTIKALINKNLQDNKAVFAFDEKNSFTLLKDDGTNYYGDNHQQIEPKGFIEQILSRNKLLKVTDHTVSGGQGANINGHTPPPPGGSGNNTRNTTHIGLVHKAIQDLENANAVTIV